MPDHLFAVVAGGSERGNIGQLILPKETNMSRDILGSSMFSDMMVLRDSKSARVSSWDKTGGNFDARQIEPGDTLELADIKGAGCIRHIYFTIGGDFSGDPRYLRDLVLRMFWDGQDTPSVEVPFGDFFGQGHERIRFFRSLMVTVNEGMELIGGKSLTASVGFNSYFPMPFTDGARLTLTNESDYKMNAVWYHIDYESLDSVPDDIGRFHAQWRREYDTVAQGESINVCSGDGTNIGGKENYVILDAEGHGNFAGYFLNVDNHFDQWYGEGDDMIFIDGEEWPPSMHGTGTEECFGGGACPNVEYAGPYTGFHLIGNKDFRGKVSMYRFHVLDPIRFQKSIRVTIEHGHANNYANDYSSTAFWYQALPHALFPKLPPINERRPHEGDDPFDKAHRMLIAVQKSLRDLDAMVATKKPDVAIAFRETVVNPLGRDIAEAFEALDNETALAKCTECKEKTDAFVAENK